MDQVILSAGNNVNLLASQVSSNNASGGAVGVTFSAGGNQNGFSFQLSANKALGKADGDSTTYNNTHVSGDSVSIKSGDDTTLKGAVIAAREVSADVGGNLRIESLQDQAVYTDKQSSSGAGVSLCIPPICVGDMAVVNISVAKAKIDSDYLSVGEQSAIRAGDGGFQVQVGGDTTLTGAQITSTQAAIDNNKNSFSTGGTLTTQDLQNRAEYEATMKSNITAPSSRRESIDIGVVEENKRMPTPLFAIDKWTSEPVGYQKVPAKEPLILTYFENSSGAPICRVTIQVVLEVGKSYTIVGGETYTPNPIPLLRGARGCEFGVMDDETQKPVPAQPAKTNLPWFAQ